MHTEHMTMLSLGLVADSGDILRRLNRCASDGTLSRLPEDDVMALAESLAGVVSACRSMTAELELDWAVISDPMLMGLN